MQIEHSSDSPKSITGETSIELNQSINDVFAYIIHDIFSYMGGCFFENHAKWSVQAFKFDSLMEEQSVIDSAEIISDYQPYFKLIFQGQTLPYKHTYLLEYNPQKKITRLTFYFEILEISFSMKPFEKLIRYSIEEGAKNNLQNIKKLIDIEFNNS